MSTAQTLALEAIADGAVEGTPVILLTGLGQQAIDWPETLLAPLLAAGYRLIRPDNRDAGLSPLCGPAVMGDLALADFPDERPLSEPPAYRLGEMAGDVTTLMDRLRLDKAHLIGYSMGGMIAQLVAAQSPDRVRSLTSLMSTAGQDWIICEPQARLAMARSIVGETALPARIAAYVTDHDVFAGPAYPIDMAALRRHAEVAVTRSYRPAGIWRQIRAVRGSGGRQDLLRRITAPTLVLHGDADRCIALSQARDMPKIVTRCEMEILPGAGHDLHPILAAQIAPMILRHLSRADAG